MVTYGGVLLGGIVIECVGWGWRVTVEDVEWKTMPPTTPTAVELEAIIVPIPPPPPPPACPKFTVADGVGISVGGKVAWCGPRVHMNDGGVILCTGFTS
jgi:hypothetical protein